MQLAFATEENSAWSLFVVFLVEALSARWTGLVAANPVYEMLPMR
jgi:hypothetical protein